MRLCNTITFNVRCQRLGIDQYLPVQIKVRMHPLADPLPEKYLYWWRVWCRKHCKLVPVATTAVVAAKLPLHPFFTPQQRATTKLSFVWL